MPRPCTYGLMYHDVVHGDEASGRTGEGPERYKLPWAAFVDHLDAIARVVPGPPLVLIGKTRQPQTGWALTFDDGGSSAVVVGEELARRGWGGHFFITTDLIGRRGFVDRNAIREVDRMGHVVGTHSVTHPRGMSLLPQTELLREWQESVDLLGDVLGKPVRTGSVPGGHYRANVARAAARAGLEVLFTSEPVRGARVEDGCLVVGRYSVRRHTSAREAAAVAAGDARPWISQWSAWSVRKPAKMLAGRQYDRIRSSLLGPRSDASRAADS
jgi:peptidoglycan/xylan/chitin deacetylase (PgdA/CDA1 family)